MIFINSSVRLVFGSFVGELGVGGDLVDPGTGEGSDTVPSVGSVPVMAVTAAFWWV